MEGVKNPNWSSLYPRPAVLLPTHLTLPRSDNPETFLKLKMRPASFAVTLSFANYLKVDLKSTPGAHRFRHAPRCHTRLWNCKQTLRTG